MPTVRIVDRRIPVGALNLAWHRLRWPPIEALAGGEYRHRALTASAAAAVALGGADRDHSRPAFPLASRSHVGERFAATIPRSFAPTPTAPIASSSCRDSSPAKCSGCSTFRQSAFPSARTARPSGRDPQRASDARGYLLYIGTIEPRKNVGGLLDAYARLIARRAEAPRLVIAGRAEHGSADVLARIDQPPLAGHVEYRGYVSAGDREALFKGAQAFVLPAFDEGFGIPAVEAMSAGVPVVVSNRGALPEVVGDAGLFIDPDDVESLAAALERLIGDADLRAACARRGLDRARHFTWAQTARDVRRAYEDAMLARRHRSPVLAGAQSSVHSRNAHRH